MKVKNHLRYLRKGIFYELFAPHRSGHGIHSPFLYKFVRQVLTSKKKPQNERTIKRIRKKAKRNTTIVPDIDYGAGSGYKGNSRKTVSQIYRHSAIPAAYGRMLFRLTNYFAPSGIIELGTSLGFSAMYLASGNPAAKILTIEGNPACARLAEDFIKEAGINNTTVINDEFEHALQNISIQHPLLVFIDGNHKREATLKYFNFFLNFKNEDSVLVFDDIHWSRGMEEAWDIIRDHGEVKVTVDLFRMGIVFFSKELSKQNFVIKF